MSILLINSTEPDFSIGKYNFGNGNIRPYLKVEYKDQIASKPKKRALLFENLDMIEEFCSDLEKNHPRSYVKLLKFSMTYIAPEFRIVHRIIMNTTKSKIS